MSEFKKYSSIENHYNAKFLTKIPTELKEQKYGVSEKLDGANISLQFTPYQPMKVGRRGDWLKSGESFFDIWNTLERYKIHTNQYQVLADLAGGDITLYGEIYGKGINDRIDYGPEKYIKIFDVMIGDVLVPTAIVDNYYSVYHKPFFVETTIYDNLYDALKVEPNYGRLSEGHVIKPYASVDYLSSGSRIIIKKKTPEFFDVEKHEKSGQKAQEFSVEILNLNEEFKSHLSENRMIDLFSKHGKMEEMSQMGTYIKLFFEDAKDDFLKNNSVAARLDQKELNAIYKDSGKAAKMLRESLCR